MHLEWIFYSCMVIRKILVHWSPRRWQIFLFIWKNASHRWTNLIRKFEKLSRSRWLIQIFQNYNFLGSLDSIVSNRCCELFPFKCQAHVIHFKENVCLTLSNHSCPSIILSSKKWCSIKNKKQKKEQEKWLVQSSWVRQPHRHLSPGHPLILTCSRAFCTLPILSQRTLKIPERRGLECQFTY